MKIIVDAYNIIGHLDHIQLSDPNKVELFTQWLIRNRKNKVHIIAVFDGQNELVGFPTTERHPGVTIIHTSGQRSADQYIMDKLDSMTDFSTTMVVSSDREIILHAKKKKVKIMGALAFIMYMQQRESPLEQKRMPKINDKHVDYWLNEFGG